jgi:hypothetical protein
MMAEAEHGRCHMPDKEIEGVLPKPHADEGLKK